MKYIIPILLLFICLLLMDRQLKCAQINNSTQDTVRFICNELLGRPEANSVTINLCADKDLDIYVEYGRQSSNYTEKTRTTSFKNNVPFDIVLINLQPGTTYYYAIRYRITGSTEFLKKEEHQFKTAKPRGSSFSFAIEADPHLDENTVPELFKLTLKNMQANDPDFLLDLGDTFMSEKLSNPTQDSITIRHLLLRSYFDLICHSIPLYLVIGNHEGELGWLLNDSANNLAIMASNTRTKYYPNPVPDNFYSGNQISEPFTGLRQNYYSWEWGNALFVVLDPYWYTKVKPGKNVNNWSWTLGEEQYQWFKSVLEKSTAAFKFVFAHQIIGGLTAEGRGGAEGVPFYEMGGKNSDSTWGFSSYRKAWELPIHQLMVKNHVNIFFHGHDHFYDMQQLDGIIYQEVPQPGNPNYRTASNAENYGYLTGKIIPSSGFLKVTVADSTFSVDYIRSYLPENENKDRINGMTDYSYTVRSGTVTMLEEKTAVPENFLLEQNYPNPFNPETTISYKIPEACNVLLKLYDTTGREIATLVDRYSQAGNYKVSFNPGKYSLASNIYFYRITAGAYSRTLKMIYIK